MALTLVMPATAGLLTLLLLLAAALNGSLLAAVGLCAAFVWACGTRQR